MGSSIAMSSGSRWRFWFLVFSLFPLVWTANVGVCIMGRRRLGWPWVKEWILECLQDIGEKRDLLLLQGYERL